MSNWNGKTFQTVHVTKYRIHIVIHAYYFQVSHIKAPKTAEDEFIEIQSATGTALQRWAVRSLTLCKLVR